jgi:hypothetical protein
LQFVGCAELWRKIGDLLMKLWCGSIESCGRRQGAHPQVPGYAQLSTLQKDVYFSRVILSRAGKRRKLKGVPATFVRRAL